MSTDRPMKTPLLRSRMLCALTWLSAALILLAPTARATPKIQHWQSGNGAQVLFVPAPELPMVDVRVVLDAGSARDGQKPGLATLTAAMLTQGAGDWDADALALRMESVGAQLGVSASRDMATVSIRSLTQEDAMETAVETLATVLSEPTFAAEDLERLRRNTLTSLRKAEESPGSIASKALWRHVFGDHPYASDPDGTPESVTSLGRDDLIQFHRRYYTAANALVAIVGDLERPQAEALAERVVGGLRPGQRPEPLPAVAELASGYDEHIDFPSSQTTVLAGQSGMRRGDPDYFPLYLGNHILGGSGLVSLLMEQVREKRGLSYSTYSYFLPMTRPGLFLMGLKTRNDQADEATEVMMATLRRFIADGPTEEELTAAKKNVTGSLPLKIAENSDILAYLTVIGFYGLPLDYLDRLTERIESVTAAQIRDAFTRRVHPDRLAVISVGRRPESEQLSANNDPDSGASRN